MYKLDNLRSLNEPQLIDPTYTCIVFSMYEPILKKSRTTKKKKKKSEKRNRRGGRWLGRKKWGKRKKGKEAFILRSHRSRENAPVDN